MTLFGKNAAFDKLLDKATSHLLLEPDWASNMNVCDMVRQVEVSPKYAVGAVKKKLNSPNPHVVMYSLSLVEAMAKNCGSAVHDELATQDFMNTMKALTKEKDPVKSKVLELIQLWAHAFRHQSKYVVVQNTFNALKSAGNSFPTLIESDAMFASENAPEWQDSDVCLHCKTAFSTLKRKHHCRNCGNIFCDDCSSKRCNIPKYGIEKDVRVCDSCYEQIKGGGTGTKPMSIKKGGHVQFNDDVAVRNFQSENKDSDSEMLRVQKEKELELQEKEELELALALSASEAESQGTKKAKAVTPSKVIEQPTPNNQSGFNSLYSTLDTSEMDPELARYLNRNYWENKAFESNATVKTTQPSAPIMPNSPNKISQSKNADSSTVTVKTKVDPVKEAEISPDQEEFLAALKSSIEIFVNRMRSNQQRGRSIAHDSAVQTLFLTLNAMQPQLLQYINEQDDKRSFFETLQDKLAQLRESREALDALREEHREKRRREEEEASRLRQIQMMQKLEIMRQKKQEFLDYQRQLAVDRMHQQEREMADRLAQQKQMMQMRQYQQQYPYSMQQQMGGGQDGGGPQYSLGAPIDGYGGQGYPQAVQYAPQPLPVADYYSMQGMSQGLTHVPRGPEGAPAHMQYVQGPPQSGPYSLPMAGQPPWEGQAPPAPPPPGPAPEDGRRPAENKREDQLISFD